MCDYVNVPCYLSVRLSVCDGRALYYSITPSHLFLPFFLCFFFHYLQLLLLTEERKMEDGGADNVGIRIRVTSGRRRIKDDFECALLHFLFLCFFCYLFRTLFYLLVLGSGIYIFPKYIESQ